ncbi:MAG: tetratricopeptide repeat protein [Chloroflexota bacterium]
MFYIKRKNYAGRWLVRIVQATLIFGIVFYGLDLLGDMVEPQEEIVVVEQVAPDVQIITIEAETPSYDEIEYFYFGLEHQRADEYYDAIADYTRAIELNSDLAASYLNRGVAYEQLGNNDSRAMTDFTSWMTRDGMTVLSRSIISDSTELTATMYEDYRYDVPLKLNSGDVVSFNVTSIQEDLVDPIIVLVDADGNPVAANDDVRRDDGSLVSMDSYINQYEVERTGQYTLMVTHAGGGSFGDITIDLDINR